MEFVGTLVAGRRLKPADSEATIKVMESLSAAGAAELEFSDGTKCSPLEAFKKGLLAREPMLAAGEFATGGASGVVGGLGTASAKLEAATREKMGKNAALTYSMAFNEAQRENPELAREYQIEVTGN